MNCPACHKPLDLSLYGVEDVSKVNATLNCYECGKLLLLANGDLLDFHKTLHAENEAWPEDGVGTGVLEL